MKNTAVTKKLFLIFVLAFILRLAFSVFYWVDKPITHDAQEYLLLANNVVEGKGFAYEIEPGDKVEHHERAPIYPLFLAGIISIFGKSYVAIKIIQSFIAAFLPLVVFGMAKKLFNERTAITGAFLTAIYPPLIWGTAEFLSETLFTVIAIMGFYFFAKYSVSDSIADLLSASLIMMIAAHTKPVMLMGYPFILLWIFLKKRKTLPSAIKHSLIFALSALLLLIPWTVRNYVVQNKLILIASEGGITFWTGNNSLAVGDGDMAANPQIKLANNRLRQENNYPSPAEMERIYYKEAFRFIREEPLSFFILLVKKTFYFWIPVGRSMSLFSAKHQLISHLSYFPVLLFAIAALITLIRRKMTPFLPLISMFSAMIACVIFFPQERYRIPLTDPFLIILAAYFISSNYQKFTFKICKKGKDN